MGVSIGERLRGKQDVDPSKKYLSLNDLVRLDHERGSQRTRPDFPQVQATLDAVVGAHVPDRLAERMGFDRLQWFGITHPNAYSALFIGIARGRHQRYEVEEAYGTIEVARQEWGRYQGPAYVDKCNVRIAGVYSDGSGVRGTVRRAIALNYRTPSDSDDSDISRVLVGVKPEELYERPDGKLTYDIPTALQEVTQEFRRSDVGLVTPEMVSQAKLWGSTDMRRALLFVAGIRYMYPAERFVKEQGFFGGVMNGDTGLVGFQMQGTDREQRYRDRAVPPAWTIPIPLSLQK